jgi:putative molybdopterin biosynthesis protein
MKKADLLGTREIAEFLRINEKMVYTLISDKGLPATKVTGKWLFPLHLVERWLENETINYPKMPSPLPSYRGLLIIVGSNDILLDRLISLFNQRYSEHVAVFGNVGSLGGLRALSRDLCHLASSHLMQSDEQEYNFDFASEEFEGEPPVLVNFCKREQGFLVAKGNPKGISGVADFGQEGIKIANRPPGTGTRLLLDRELEKAGIEGVQIDGYQQEFRSHLDVAMEVFSGRADSALAIRPVAGLLDLGFVPLRWERYDLLISKARFFEQGVQNFLGLLNEPQFRKVAQTLEGYDLSLCGKMVFSNQTKQGGMKR